MVHGSFLTDRDLATIQVPIAFRETVVLPTFIIDTGFSGDIKVDPQTADELGIETQGVAHIDIANGEQIAAGLSQGYVELENVKKPVAIIIANGSPLVGMGLFTLFKYKVVIDCRNRTAHLESTI